MPAKRFAIIFNPPYAMSNFVDRTTADEEWESLLHQWRAEVDTPPQPYFYSRVRAKLVDAAGAQHPPLRTWRHWPAYAVMLGILLLLSGDDAALHSMGGLQQEGSHQPEASFSGN